MLCLRYSTLLQILSKKFKDNLNFMVYQQTYMNIWTVMVCNKVIITVKRPIT